MNCSMEPKYDDLGSDGCLAFNRRDCNTLFNSLGTSHQFKQAPCKYTWRELVHLIMLQRMHRVPIILGATSSSLSPPEKKTKDTLPILVH